MAPPSSSHAAEALRLYAARGMSSIMEPIQVRLMIEPGIAGMAARLGGT